MFSRSFFEMCTGHARRSSVGAIIQKRRDHFSFLFLLCATLKIKTKNKNLGKTLKSASFLLFDEIWLLKEVQFGIFSQPSNCWENFVHERKFTIGQFWLLKYTQNLDRDYLYGFHFTYKIRPGPGRDRDRNYKWPGGPAGTGPYSISKMKTIEIISIEILCVFQ